MYSQSFRTWSAALLASLVVAACSSKNDGVVVVVDSAGGPAQGGDSSASAGTSAGGSAAQAGSTMLVVMPDAGSSNDDGVEMSSAGAYATTLPPGFTAANLFGGYRVGDPITSDETGDAGSSGTDTSKSCGTTILAVIRDFQADGKNFEAPIIGDDRGLVKPDLGADRKPVFAPSGPTATVADPAQFDSWYRNVDGLNKPYKFEIWFAPNKGVTSFQSTAFFPLDGMGFGNDGTGLDGKQHNFHFTTEIHTQFKYGGGEVFNFTGDDDVWVFINNKLAIDLGGVHPAEDASIDIDSQADALGLKIGKVYPFDMFQTERHTNESNFRADTTLNFVDCGTIVPEIPK